jgi:hypothetical protein
MSRSSILHNCSPQKLQVSLALRFKENKLKFIILLISLVPMLSFGSPGSWTPSSQKILEIIVEGAETDGRALVVIEGGVPSSHIPSACNSPYNTIVLNSDKGRAMYSMALAAYMSGKTVKLALACTGNRPLITHIRINK